MVQKGLSVYHSYVQPVYELIGLSVALPVRTDMSTTMCISPDMSAEKKEKV